MRDGLRFLFTSVGLAVVVAGATSWALSLNPKWRPPLLALGLVAALALFVRTVVRNPSWMSTFVMQQALNEDLGKARGKAAGSSRVVREAALFADRSEMRERETLPVSNFSILGRGITRASAGVSSIPISGIAGRSVWWGLQPTKSSATAMIHGRFMMCSLTIRRGSAVASRANPETAIASGPVLEDTLPR